MHEQMIDWLKNYSGVIGNLYDPRTGRREQVARPEMARVVQELEGEPLSESFKHHEQFSQFQANFKSDVLAMAAAFEELGNLFLEEW